MDKELYEMDLDGKIDKSLKVLEEAKEKFNNIGVGFTGGKDSLTTLDLVSEVIDDFKIIFVDTGQHFDEVYDFVEKTEERYDAPIIHAKNTEVLEKANGTTVKKQNLGQKNQEELEKIEWDEFEVAEDREPCCHLLKTVAFQETLSEIGIDGHINGIRWDEQESRRDEEYFSSREDHTRVHPILHWSEDDVWSYIKTEGLKYNPLYDKGYRSIGCKPCTNKVSEDADHERAGRAQDKEKVMERLRSLGYM
ncbi:MAG: 3'-phosphoadenosine 5'-phosphosulfate sulfotransferase (PAPS reductase) CysH [Candidatus Methanohalarchaeum thermophilum]|uniref:3'-phosphoadenosine 5'-phosphosulfate sulfotransferase (PAPS reductase) CysH n=1 Tax=Methanohalarchaeum thermophilum TaxID=1903181 RepID=A0A1Q6DUE5_METT1|nr:MAG: 3'-phosphoadenosine 5'-phosphosulfate sulfotransferase (PAPS reductase) CysH [Candidatus Methanohalarchaeum thermophilum]